MAGRNGSQVRRRILARELRKLREAAGLTLEEAAPRLDFSDSTLSRIENAQQGANVHAVKSMLDLYDAGDRWEELLALARVAKQRGWWQAYGLGGGGASYVGFETEAGRVRDFTVSYVPGLLQTADYARALFAAGMVWDSGQALENAVAVRTIRQERLTDSENPLHLEAIIDEAALRRPVGGPAVHRAQLEHLLRAVELPTVTLQVLPTRVGAHPALASPFTLLSFGDLGEPDIAYVEHTLGAVTFDKEPDVARARLFFDRLRAEALGLADSAALVRGVLDGSG
ncbi:helix-turn-helix domain-containing protein [Pseudonocardia sp.]|uniref:helix-turn-helix domain-containing protein n=1 Tax=Pseudonocardia sp. TaxID=60912 RepID=UPI003D0AC629